MSSLEKIRRAYHNMKQRCYNDKNPRFKDYGGRGVLVCDEWRDNIDAFISWSLDNGYSDELTIDRIDNELGYSPNNCRWVSHRVQASNKRARSKSVDKVPAIAEYFGVPYRTMLRWSQEENASWRYRLYAYLVQRYKKETL